MLQFILPALMGGGISALRGGDARDIGLGALLGGATGGITSGLGSLFGAGAGDAASAAAGQTGYFHGLPELTAYTPPSAGAFNPTTLSTPNLGDSMGLGQPLLGTSQPRFDMNTHITAGLGQPSKMDEFLKSDVFKGMMAAMASAGGGRQMGQRAGLPPANVGRLGQPITQLPSIFPR